MLVLSRSNKESIRIYTQEGVIEIVIASVHGKLVKLGIEAPKTMTVLRREIDPNCDGSKEYPM